MEECPVLDTVQYIHRYSSDLLQSATTNCVCIMLKLYIAELVHFRVAADNYLLPNILPII